MTQSGAVAVVDVAHLDDPRNLAAAISDALGSTGFLFVRGHGLEKQAEKMFSLSGALARAANALLAPPLTAQRQTEHFFRDESEEEKARCAYADNKGYTKVSQER